MQRVLVSLAVSAIVLVGLAACFATPADIARLDHRTDVLSYSVWGEDFATDLKLFESDMQSRVKSKPRALQARVTPYTFPVARFDPQPAPSWTVLVFHSEYCPPCRRLISESLLPLAKSQWTTGPYGDSTSFQLIDGDRHPDLVTGFRIAQFPTIVVMKKGVEVARRTGFVDRVTLSHWVNSHIAPPRQLQYAPACRGRRCQ